MNNTKIPANELLLLPQCPYDALPIVATSFKFLVGEHTLYYAIVTGWIRRIPILLIFGLNYKTFLFIGNGGVFNGT